MIMPVNTGVCVGGSADRKQMVLPEDRAYLEVQVMPTYPPFDVVPDNPLASVDIEREVYHREVLRTGDYEFRFWRHEGLTTAGAMERLFASYAGILPDQKNK